MRDANINFSVLQSPLYYKYKGKTIESHLLMNVRKDNGAILGYVSQGYKLINHKTMIDETYQALKKAGLTVRQNAIEHYVTNGGSRVISKFNFPEKIVLAKNDIINLGLWIYQSYDGSLCEQAIFGLMRLVCTNGMVIGLETYAKLKWMHRANFGIDKFIAGLSNGMDEYKNKSVEKIQSLIDMKCSYIDGKGLVASMTGAEKEEKLKKKKSNKPEKKITRILPKRFFEPVSEYFKSPTIKEDKEKNLWSLYNACTYHIERDNKFSQIKKNESTNKVFNYLSKQAH